MAKKKINHGMTSEEFEKFANEFKTESDRAAVILGASQLDLLLYQILERFLLPCTSGKDELLDGDSPLATFSSRINISYRLGLIEADFARALHLIRRIRNSFAHEISSASLNAGSHRDRIKELVAPFSENWALIYMIEKYFDDDHSPASQFRAVVGVMCFRLDGAIKETRKSTHETWTLLPPDYEESENSKENHAS
ncbi:hypothetical protein [Sulfurimonas microaerophilic]|uniref:hypothetical protein n=1 Tax=Sulfurimonas microaerophilic TaxID=3058392 RepID=UPI00271532F4|nr:hypothetical protein [Sulfurimonas sp. hsl 1-7]